MFYAYSTLSYWGRGMSSAWIANVSSAPPRRPRTADVRSALVQAAVAVLERDGLPGLTVRAVAAEAGVAPMGVYNHLHGKDGLLVAALAQAFDNLTAAATWPADLPPDEAFLETGRRYRRFALAAPSAYSLMFGAAGESVHERLASHADPAFEALLGIVRAGQQAGVIRDGDVQTIAMTIWSTVHGAVSLELTLSIPTEEAVPIYDATLQTLARGLAP